MGNLTLSFTAMEPKERGFPQKRTFQCAFDDNLSVTHVVIKQIFRAACIPIPSPPQCCVKGWGSSGSFQPQAVAFVMSFKL
jgi:hypothetical protein